MQSNHLLVGLVAVLVAGGLLLAFFFVGSDEPTDIDGPLVPTVEAQGPGADLEAGEAQEDEPEPEPTNLRTAVAATGGIEATAWDADSGGVIGRVIEEGGEPVVGIPIALLQVDANLMLAADWAAMGETPPDIVLERSQTDGEGRFRLDGASATSFQGLGIDLRGPRSTVRIVDAQVHRGEVTDLGDIILPAGCTILGRVVDEDGAPVAGARVRIVQLPEMLRGNDLDMAMGLGIQDVRADCAAGITILGIEEGMSPVIEPPPLIRNHIDDLPIPTATTDAEGKYRFEGAPIGFIVQGADKKGMLGEMRTETTTAGENTLSDMVLKKGRTIFGVVVEEAGDPLEGIEVLVGSELPFGGGAVLHPAGPTDANGEFSLSGMPDSGNVMACARRGPEEAWVAIVESPGMELELELPIALTAVVRVQDPEGNVVRGAKLELAPALNQEGPMMGMAMFSMLGKMPREPRFQEQADGSYTCSPLTPGSYQLTVRPPGLAIARQNVEFWEGEEEVTVTCERGSVFELTVIDAATGEGVPDARASLLGPAFPFVSALAVARTNARGLARLGPFTNAKPEEDPFGMMGMMGDGRQVLVQHPRYADAALDVPEGATTGTVSLLRGGEIHGRITWGEEPPQTLYMVVLENKEGLDDILEAFFPPRIGRNDLTGAFKFTNLPAGKYEMTVFDRFLDRDPLTLMVEMQEPTMVHVENDIELEPAGRTDVVIDLSPTGRGQTARLAGSVQIDGRPVVGARVRVSGRGPGGTAETDSLGHFETSDFLALGEVRVSIRGDVDTPQGQLEGETLYSDSLTPTPHTVHRLDLDLQSRSVKVKVTNKAGVPVVGANVTMRSSRSWRGRQSSNTDAQGETELVLIGDSSRRVGATADGYAEGATEFDPGSPNFTGQVEIVLQGAVSCSGLVDLTAFTETIPPMGAWMWVTGPGANDSIQLSREDLVDDRIAPFRFEGLQPGTYTVHLWMGRQEAVETELIVPEGGDENVYLAIEPVRSDEEG